MSYINEYADNNDEQDALQEYAAIDHHKEIWEELFGSSQVDFRAYFPVGSFDEHRDSPEHLQDLGLRLVELYRSSFLDDNGYWQDETTAPVYRACDIKDSLLSKAMGGFLEFPGLFDAEEKQFIIDTIERES
jgi:hypothetical protein